MSTTKSESDETAEVEEGQSSELWYHFLAKGWECPGHDANYGSSTCIGAVYVG